MILLTKYIKSGSETTTVSLYLSSYMSASIFFFFFFLLSVRHSMVTEMLKESFCLHFSYLICKKYFLSSSISETKA